MEVGINGMECASEASVPDPRIDGPLAGCIFKSLFLTKNLKVPLAKTIQNAGLTFFGF